MLPPFLIPISSSGILEPRRNPSSSLVTQERWLVLCGHPVDFPALGLLNVAEPGIAGLSGMEILVVVREELELYVERRWRSPRDVRSGELVVEGNVYCRIVFSCWVR